MKTLTFEDLNSLFSPARMLPYLSDSDSAYNALEKYHLNIQLSEAMIPSLHYLEVCLRNKLDNFFRKHYTNDWLKNSSYYSIFSERDIKKIKETIRTKRYHKRDTSHDDIVAQMTFGFWCSFFHKRYDPILWHRKNIFRDIFPNLSRINRKRSHIENKILAIKEVRNRIAHHESIWHCHTKILQIHKLCYELIEAMSSDAIKMLKNIDRFPQIYKQTYNLLSIKEPTFS